MTIQRDIVLLLWSESEIDSGLSLLCQAYESSGYDSAIFVMAENPKSLVEQVKGRLQKQCQSIANQCTVVEMPLDQQVLVLKLKSNAALRLLLLPGLDQINDIHRYLLKTIDVSVACYQTHQNIVEPADYDILVGEDASGAVKSFRHVMGDERPIRECELDPLLQAAANKAPVKSDLSGRQISEEQRSVELENDTKPVVQKPEPWHFMVAAADTWESQLKRSKTLMEEVRGPVILVRAERGWSRRALRSRWLRQVAQSIPQMEREQRKQLSEELNRESKPSFDFLALICASSFLAAFGLAQDSAAVIIGAMLVAPLMSPILAAGLALAQGNRQLFAQSLTTVLIGFLAAVSAGAMFGFLMQLLPNNVLKYSEKGYILTNEMWSRTYPGPLDFLVGLVGGSAAAYARTRKELSSALAGAAIAAALVPPIATAGIELSLLWRPIQPEPDHQISNLVLGPSLLFFANMLTIMIGSSLVLWACGIRSVHDHSSKERWAIRMSALLAVMTILVFAWIVQQNR